MGSFFSKQKIHEIEIYRGVMCLDNEEWCKIWRATDLMFQYLNEKFDEVWSQILERLKSFNFFYYDNIYTKREKKKKLNEKIQRTQTSFQPFAHNEGCTRHKYLEMYL